MLSAVGWGALAASSLVLGAILGVARSWSDGLVGAVLGFGAGALISSVAFELAEEGLATSGPTEVAIGLAVGAASYFLANRLVARIGGRSSRSTAGVPMALGALLDGIPEQAVLGIGLASGGGVGVSLLVAIFVSNLPESIGSATAMRAAGEARRPILLLWLAVSAACALATVVGYAVADVVGPSVRSGVDGFAAGALLVMLVDSMVPEAREKAGDWAGLATVLGFAVAAALSKLA
jgi:ZIP family zinc transporter